MGEGMRAVWVCGVCGHEWLKGRVEPKECPKRGCRSKRWNEGSAKPKDVDLRKFTSPLPFMKEAIKEGRARTRKVLDGEGRVTEAMEESAIVEVPEWVAKSDLAIHRNAQSYFDKYGRWPSGIEQLKAYMKKGW